MQIELPEALMVFVIGQFANTIVAAHVTKKEMTLLRESVSEMRVKFEEAIENLSGIVTDHETRLAVNEDRADRHSEQLKRKRDL